MKLTGKCPKCESSDLIQIPGQIGAYGSGNNVPLGLFKSPVKVTRFLCGKCGFSEEWIDSGEEIERLRKTYAQCVKCGYDLRASMDRCPECGSPVPARPAA